MGAAALHLVRFQPEHQEAILALHRSAMSRFTVGMSAAEEEADLRDIDMAYLRDGGESLYGRVVTVRFTKEIAADYRLA
jgi:hypothetical protein